MYWVIHYSNGVAITRADSHEAAEDWCVSHLGHSKAPFSITPAKDEDLEESSAATICIDQPGFNDDRSLSRFLVVNDKLATRH
ncbi:MAG: hypothetical protein L3J24_13990 [Xanthomonadales bacterium]|nr:hypothetical protein [Xanthomonadales bacterium]